MTDANTLMLTVDEAAKSSRLSRSEIYRAFNSGDLPARKKGRRTLVLRDDLNQFLKRLPVFGSAT